VQKAGINFRRWRRTPFSIPPLLQSCGAAAPATNRGLGPAPPVADRLLHRHFPSLYSCVSAGHVTVTVVLSLAEGVTVVVVVVCLCGATGGGVLLIEMQPINKVDANITTISFVNIGCVPLNVSLSRFRGL
jgi:hypothetical protein